MLVLTRRIGEEIMIAGDIVVTILAIKGQRIHLGITAPATVPVARMELFTKSAKGTAPPTGDRREDLACH